eukprot:m.1098986 g.1098986  ORF g.1098986 m.1098986 type:complete len:93 (-) comp24315_c0_seq33:301-579(-)
MASGLAATQEQAMDFICRAPQIAVAAVNAHVARGQNIAGDVMAKNEPISTGSGASIQPRVRASTSMFFDRSANVTVPVVGMSVAPSRCVFCV